MAKLKLSKSALAQERNQLKLYERTLPSLDLKRRQLSVELNRARQALDQARQAVEELESNIGEQLPMLANTGIELQGLVNMTDFELVQENVVGVRLPLLQRIHCTVADYSLLAKPAWVDVLVERLKDAAELRTQVLVAAERVRILEYQEKRVTQRVNLFDKILIPTAKRNIQRIQIFLGDAERAAVVRSKIAKAKQARLRNAMLQPDTESTAT
ncbi:MAG: V-type ATP synthase subunit D [Gammaproteobacteria bacterium]|nr:V-type ATP synthase subunit D [Gammaproteobacteria bacterium]